MKNYLDFEKEVKSLEQEVDGLKSPFGSEGISEVDTQKIKNTQNEINEKLKETYANLNSWQRTQVARHEDRPKANFYIKKIFSQFTKPRAHGAHHWGPIMIFPRKYFSRKKFCLYKAGVLMGPQIYDI